LESCGRPALVHDRRVFVTVSRKLAALRAVPLKHTRSKQNVCAVTAPGPPAAKQPQGINDLSPCLTVLHLSSLLFLFRSYQAFILGKAFFVKSSIKLLVMEMASDSEF
ncbi:hypothetical protein AOLI_G00305990, partial [Acnodon oligacanthus]